MLFVYECPFGKALVSASDPEVALRKAQLAAMRQGFIGPIRIRQASEHDVLYVITSNGYLPKREDPEMARGPQS